MSQEMIYGKNDQKRLMKPIAQKLNAAGVKWYEDKHETHGLYTWYDAQASTKTGFTAAQLETLAHAALTARLAGAPMPAIVSGTPKTKKDAQPAQPAQPAQDAQPAQNTAPALPGTAAQPAQPAVNVPVTHAQPAQPGSFAGWLNLTVTVTVKLSDVLAQPNIAGWLDNAPPHVQIVVK